MWKQNYSHKKATVEKKKAEEGEGGKADLINQWEICTGGINYEFNNFYSEEEWEV